MSMTELSHDDDQTPALPEPIALTPEQALEVAAGVTSPARSPTTSGYFPT